MLNDLRYRLRALFRHKAVERELEDELHFHFDHEVEKNMNRGMNKEEAARRARLAFGAHEQAKEDCREARGTNIFELTLDDTKYAVRQLWANPTFALVIIRSEERRVGKECLE